MSDPNEHRVLVGRHHLTPPDFIPEVEYVVRGKSGIDASLVEFIAMHGAPHMPNHNYRLTVHAHTMKRAEAVNLAIALLEAAGVTFSVYHPK